MRILPEKTVALFIDYQERLIPAMSNPDGFVGCSAILAKGLMTLDIPIVVSEQYPKGLGTTVPHLKNLPGFPAGISKTTFSCFDTAEIENAIKETGAKNIIICGCEAHVCVLQTVIDFLSKGYNCILVTDCIDSRHKYDKEAGIERAKQEGAYVTTYEAILFELLREAKGDAFKAISALVK